MRTSLWVRVACAAALGCGAGTGSVDAEESPNVEGQVIGLIDVRDANWTLAGRVGLLAMLDARPSAAGRVVCTLHEVVEGMVEDVVWTTMRGDLRDAYTHRGPRPLPTLAVPLYLPADFTFDGLRRLHAKCAIETQEGRGREYFDSYVALGPGQAPDLELPEGAWFEAHDCDTGGPPRASGAFTCVRVAHSPPVGLHNALNQQLLVGVSCILEPASGATQFMHESVLLEALQELTLRSRLHPGDYAIRCETDASHHIPESDESNNSREARFSVATEVRDADYGMQIHDIGRAHWHTHVPRPRGEENGGGWNEPGGPDLRVVVGVENTGLHPIHRLVIECRGAGGARFASAGHHLAPGERLDVQLSGIATSGTHELECEARMLQPTTQTPVASTARGRIAVPPAPPEATP